MQLRTLDLFCGAGGSSWGAFGAGAKIVAAFDTWDVACRAYKENFPKTRVYQRRLEEITPARLKNGLGEIDLIIASPECTSHSTAKGAGPRSNRSRNTAFQVVDFAKAFKPRWIIVENVVSMRRWSRYETFKKMLEDEGYHVREQILSASDFGVPQRRRRLYLLCDRKRRPRMVPRRRQPAGSASSIVNMNGEYRLTPLTTKRRAAATLLRARRAIRTLGPNRPFLLVYYGSDGAGGWQRLSSPLRTITTLDRFALVRKVGARRSMRMLQVPELKKAMGMPQRFSLGGGTRREQIHLLGNAVCPPVMRAIVRSLTRTPSGATP